jgi:DNA-binding response OmpR family regulator
MKTILCIDDDAWVLQTFREALTQRGYRVLVTTSTSAAPSCLKYEKVDLVLLDLYMPTKHGLAVYRELHAMEDVPVLFVTGSRTFDPKSESFKQEYQNELSGIRTDILYKPFTITALYEKVESLIGPCACASLRKN